MLDYIEQIGQRLKAAREEAGFESAAEAARYLGVREPTYAGHENGSRGVSLNRARQYATAYRISLTWLLTGRGEKKGKDPETESSSPQLFVRGIVRAGAWLENDEDQFQQDGFEADRLIPVTVNPRFQKADQYALRVEGNSMNKIAVPGEYIIVADWNQLYRPFEDDLLMVIRRQRGTTFETSLKRLRLTSKGEIELWPESTDPRWADPIEVGHDDAEIKTKIVGLVIGKYTPPHLLSLRRRPI